MLKFNFSSFKTILFVALIFRLITAIFSEGYGMHDDHFLTIEASSSWVNGYDYNGWLPWSENNRGEPEGHSFTYVGLNFVFFWLCKLIGISDPKLLMVFNRSLHALLSLLVVYFGIKITNKVSTRKNAVLVGWLLALLWLMPFMSVRNLVEMVSVPFLMWGTWMLLRSSTMSSFIYGGMLLGFAVSLRYQIAVFSFGIAIYYLWNKQLKNLLLFSLGNVITFALTQGIVDYYIWGYPFAEFWSYATYNMKQGTQYMPNTNYFMYFYVLFGVMLFPFGLLIGAGFFRSSKKYFFLFFPTFCFLLFHTLYPNRQERFILSVLPFFILLGVIGYDSLRGSKRWNSLWNFSWKAFWVINIPLLAFFTFTSTKESRVNAMYAIYNSTNPKPQILLEGSGNASISMMPKFYGNKWYASFSELTERPGDVSVINPSFSYIFFFGEDDLKQRVSYYKQLYPNIHLVKKCKPSLVDQVVKKLNPRNVNEYIEVWETN